MPNYFYDYLSMEDYSEVDEEQVAPQLEPYCPPMGAIKVPNRLCGAETWQDPRNNGRSDFMELMDPQDINEEHGGEMVYNDQAVLQKQLEDCHIGEQSKDGDEYVDVFLQMKALVRQVAAPVADLGDEHLVAVAGNQAPPHPRNQQPDDDQLGGPASIDLENVMMDESYFPEVAMEL